MTRPKSIVLSKSLTKLQIDAIRASLKLLEKEFPDEWDLDTLEQETLEVALDDIVIRLIKKKIIRRDFSKTRNFTSAFKFLFGDSHRVATLARKLEESTSEYSDEFSAHAALNAFHELSDALKGLANDAD
jgi:hypothetical protein